MRNNVCHRIYMLEKRHVIGHIVMPLLGNTGIDIYMVGGTEKQRRSHAMLLCRESCRCAAMAGEQWLVGLARIN